MISNPVRVTQRKERNKMGEELKIAKMVSKANGGTGFYLDLVTVEVLGILEKVEDGSRIVPGKLVISKDGGSINADIRIDTAGCFYIPLRKSDLETLNIYPHYIGSFIMRYDETL